MSFVTADGSQGRADARNVGAKVSQHRAMASIQQDAEKVRQRRSHIAQRLNESFPEAGSTEGAFPFAKIHCRGERPHEVRDVPPHLFARCGLAGQPF